MTPDADLYLDSMDLEKYCPGETCQLCKADSFDEFLERIKSGRIRGGDCPHWTAQRIEAFRFALDFGDVIPSAPMLDTPRPAKPGLLTITETDDGSPVLVTGNSEFSQNLMLALIAMAANPMELVSVDCLGHTVDMAMVFRELTAEKISMALQKVLGPALNKPRIIIPGLAQTLAPKLEATLGRTIEVGPICAAELPLYMEDDWQWLKLSGK